MIKRRSANNDPLAPASKWRVASAWERNKPVHSSTTSIFKLAHGKSSGCFAAKLQPLRVSG